MIYEIYEDEYTGKEMVGLWEKVNIDNSDYFDGWGRYAITSFFGCVDKRKK